jgi:predicted HTH transcriptional regulator
MSDDEKYIYDLIAEGEHQQQDFKFEITSARKIARTLVAFANTDGGRLLIGVKDNGRVSGIKTDEEYYMIEAAASMYCRPAVPFESFHRRVAGKTVLEVVITPSADKPHFAQDDNSRWLAYHRVKDQNFLADYILLQVWRRKKRAFGTFIAYSEKEEKLLEILRSGGPAELNMLKEEMGSSRKTVQQILINLVSLQAITMVFREERTLFEINDAIDI